MVDVIERGLVMCNKHIYRMTRWNNGKGGASKIPPDVIKNDVLGLFSQKINNYAPLLTYNDKDVVTEDLWIPNDMHEWIRKINVFVNKHGYSQVIAVTLMDSIIDMTRFGIHELRQYRRFIERLDSSPPQSFHDYIQICIEYEKEMKQ